MVIFPPPLISMFRIFVSFFFFFLLMFWVTTISVCGAGQQNLYPVRRRRKNFFPTKKGKHKRKNYFFCFENFFCCVAMVTGILSRCMGVCFFARVPFSAVFLFFPCKLNQAITNEKGLYRIAKLCFIYIHVYIYILYQMLLPMTNLN